jgi:hypothetical protein
VAEVARGASGTGEEAVRCYFIGGSLDGMIKEIQEPLGRYRGPVLTHNMGMVLSQSKPIRYGVEEYGFDVAQVAGRYYDMNGQRHEVGIYTLQHVETGRSR